MKIWHFKNNWIKDREGERERKREGQHRQPRGSIDSLSLFIFSLRNDGNTHSEPPHLPTFSLHSHGNCALWTNTPCNLFSSLLTVYPASPHPLLFFYSVPQSSLFHIRPVQDKYLTLAKKRYSIE